MRYDRLSLVDLKEIIRQMQLAQAENSKVVNIIDLEDREWSVVVRPLGVSILVKTSKYAGMASELNEDVRTKRHKTGVKGLISLLKA